MSFIAVILTIGLILNCLLLIGLVLIQLPKKDAGAGLAFGSGAADALFGAGSGNALTKITKWATIVFLVMCLFLGFLLDKLNSRGDGSDFTKKIQEKQMQVPAATPPAPAPAMSSLPASVPAAAAAVSTNAAK